jgi:SAM-dependent methyltransferase
MRDRPLIITAFPEAREFGISESPTEFMLRTRDDVYQPGLPAKPGEHYRAFVRFASEHAGSTILDLGCGYGAYSLALAAEGRKCIGSDVNMKYLTAASGSGLPVVAVDSVLPFPDRSFDTVMLLEVIEHVPKLEGILKEAFRVARRNVLVTVPNSESLERLQENDVTYAHMLSSDHVHFFDPASLEKLLAQFGSKVEIRRGDPIYPFWFVSRSVAYYALRVLYRSGLLKPGFYTRLYAVASVREN